MEKTTDMQSKEKEGMSGRRLISCMSKWCAYRYLYLVITTLIKGGSMSGQVKAGRNMALLGLCCPIFWMALFSGERGAALAFHAMHSGVVCLLGIAIMIAGLVNQKDRHE
ncbi:hypothetical protein [Pontiella agarivorans]|uniref:DUF2933 domain-containing protein n=1 Tax=Pontiella agarivorans TaxID=3038953 RepID=A0ABU5MW73_9BACT|nr:hypothetical protein [Pontiella agarivorans]MDZ8118474.1 hypothetical protein [Pontiella agarivorans]